MSFEPTSLILIVLAALVAVIASRRPESNIARADSVAMGALVATGAAGIALAWRFSPPGQQAGTEIGLGVGVLAAAVAALIGRNAVSAAAFGVLGGSVMHLLPAETRQPAQIALVAAAALGAIVMHRGFVSVTALAAAGVAAADFLGYAAADGGTLGRAGTVLGVAGTAAALVTLAIPAKHETWRSLVAQLTVLAVVVVASALFSAGSNAAITATIGAIAAVVVAWLVGDESEGDPLRVGLATATWIGVATITFGFARGFGMGVAFAAALFVLLAGGRTRAILTTGPLLGLVMYRVFREEHTSWTRALDIGQHYALLGLALGAVLPLLPADWLGRDGLGKRGVVGAALLGLLSLALPAVVITLFGAKGAVGFVAGLGFSGLLQAVRAERSLLPLAIAAGAAASSVMIATWLGDLTDLSRDQKVQTLLIAGVVLALIGGALAVLGRGHKAEEVLA